MILYLGSDCVVPDRNVIAILDVDNVQTADTRAFLERAQAEGTVVTVPDGPAKSAVVTMGGDGVQRVYLSPISTATLRGRSAFFAGASRGAPRCVLAHTGKTK